MNSHRMIRHLRSHPHDEQGRKLFAAAGGKRSDIDQLNHKGRRLAVRAQEGAAQIAKAARYDRREPKRRKYFEALERQRAAGRLGDFIRRAVDDAVTLLKAVQA